MDFPEPSRTNVDPEGAADFGERVDSLAAWVNEIDARLRATEAATGDEKTARELRKAIEAHAKLDPKLEQRVTDRVAVLSDRLETLASTIAQAAASQATRDGEIAGLRRELEAAEKRIEAVGSDPGRGVDPREVARLRSMIDAVAAQGTARASDARVDELAGKIRFLADRIDSLGATVGIAAATVGRRETDLADLRDRLDSGALQVEALTAELRRLQRDGDLVLRLEALDAAVAAANGGVAARKEETSRLRGRIDEAYSQVGTVVTDLQRGLGRLATQVAALETLPESTSAALDSRAAELGGTLDALGEQVDAVAGEVESALRELESNRTHVDTVVAALRAELVESGARVPELDARLDLIATKLEKFAADTTLGAATSASRAVELETTLATVSNRLDAIEQEREDAAALLRRTDEKWLEERDWVRRRLQRLAAAHDEATENAKNVGPELAELRTRLDDTEAARDAVASEVRRLSHARDSEHSSVQEQLDRLAATVAAVTRDGERSDQLAALIGRIDDLEHRETAGASELARTTTAWTSEIAALGERLDRIAAGRDDTLVRTLAARLDAAERERAEAASELTHAAATWASERESLSARIEDLSVNLARVGSAAQSAAAAAAVAAAGTPHDHVVELHARVDKLSHTLASREKEVAAVESARDARARIDELARRLESIERAAPVTILPDTDELPAGDGRFRIEFRALELRMEHTEAASRENREAVLTQLERLASRVEWRLQQLEALAEEPYSDPVVVGAQVVPIRGTTD